MEPEIQTKISLLAQCYQKMTGMTLTHTGLVNPRERAWFEFIKAGFTVPDLELVILWLKGRIRAKVRNPECLKFSNLIADPFKFEEELALAKAEKRNSKPFNPRDQVLLQARPVVAQVNPAETRNTAKPISEYIAKLREAAK